MERSSGGKLNFLSRGVTTPCLRGDGKLDSTRQRLRKVVIGGNSAGKHDLSRKDGITSSAHHESREERMMLLTSSVVVEEKTARMGGGAEGEYAMTRERLLEMNKADFLCH